MVPKIDTRDDGARAVVQADNDPDPVPKFTSRGSQSTLQGSLYPAPDTDETPENPARYQRDRSRGGDRPRFTSRGFTSRGSQSTVQGSLHPAPDTDEAPENPAHNTDEQTEEGLVRRVRRVRTYPTALSIDGSVVQTAAAECEDTPSFYELLKRLTAAHELAVAHARRQPRCEHSSSSLQASPHYVRQSSGSGATNNLARQSSTRGLRTQIRHETRTQGSNKSVSRYPSEPSTARRTNKADSDVDFKLVEVWSQDPSESLHRYTFSFSPKQMFMGSRENLVSGHSCIQPFIVHPNSMKRLAWDLLSMMVLAYDIIMIPYVSAFDPPVMQFTMGMNDATMVFWSLDMLASLLTGYQDGRDIVLQPKAIVKRYIKTWLVLDIFIVVLDWTLFFLRESESTGSSAASLARSLKTLRFTRTLRLIRLFKVKRILQGIQEQINTEALSICFRIMKIILVLLLANHTVACAWYGIGRMRANTIENGGLGSWVEYTQMDQKTLTYRYVTSLHWSLTQFTPASMEVSPQNEGERIFAVVVLLLAMITFSSFVSILTASMAELRNISSDEEKQFWLLRRYLRDWGVSKRFAVRLQRYLEFAYTKQRQRVQAKDVKLLALLSGPLCDELKAETFSVHLLVHPLFFASSSTMRVFSRALSDMYLGQGDFAFSCGEQGSSMLFLCTGIFSYQLGELVTVKPSISEVSETASITTGRPQQVCEGQWVAEAVLWTQWLHLGDLTALTDGQAISIDAQTFGRSVMVYRPSWMDFRMYALRFVQAMNRIDPNELTDLTHQNLNSQEIVNETSVNRHQSLLPSIENNDSPFVRLGRALWARVAAAQNWLSETTGTDSSGSTSPA